jgi:hypothetical protein
VPWPNRSSAFWLVGVIKQDVVIKAVVDPDCVITRFALSVT